MAEMQKTARKDRSDSAAAALQAAINAASPDLMPPGHVQISADAMPYYRDIVRARARDEWNDFQLTIAAQLAECMAKQVEIDSMIALEGLTVTNQRGTEVANPLVSILERMAARQQSLARSLQMVGRVALGDPRANTNKRKNEDQARRARKQAEAEGDGLLAS